MKRYLGHIAALLDPPRGRLQQRRRHPPRPAPPEITLDSPTSIYTVKSGREIEIRPTYKNADGATFAWRMDKELLGEEPVLRFRTERSGSYTSP